MSTSVKIIMLLILSCSAVITAGNAVAWQLEHSDKNIKIYLQNNNSPIKTFKGETIVNAPVDSILNVLSDVDACPDWFHYCKNPMVIDDISATERYHYLVNTVPFPANNRDFIFHSKIVKNPINNSVTITMVSVPDYCKDKQSEVCQKINNSDSVRVRDARGYYLLEPMGDNSTKVTWTQFTDPAGHLPVWLVNMMLKNVPLTALQGLQKKAQEEKYLHAKFNFGPEVLAKWANLN